MDRPTTVLVLTPTIGGHYFGEVLSGLAREVAASGGRLVLVQTLAAGARTDEVDAPGDFDLPIAWSEVDGVVAITSAVGGAYLQRVRDAGKPVVLTSARIDGFAAPLAVPDNHGGVFAAMEHLIGHGHTRIGFVGNLGQADIRDRYTAYLEALETYGLEPDPALLFEAAENSEHGGVVAAQALLAAAQRPSALMVATDRNALGLLRTLSDAGVAVPGDVAIIGFDNIPAGAFCTPSLSSVNQRFDEIGALSGRLLLAQLRGEAVGSTAFTTQSVVVAVRESCGCVAAPPADDDGGGGALEGSAGLLRDELQDVLSGALLTGHDVVEGAQHDAVIAAADAAERLVALGDDVTAAQIQSLISALRQLTARPDVLRRITSATTDYVQRSGATVAADAGRARAVAGPARMIAALWQLQAVALLWEAEATSAALEEQFIVDAGLLDSDATDPHHLDWLAGTHVRAGALALWEDGPSSGRLRIVGTHDPAGLLPHLVGTATTPQDFPPTALIAAARGAERGVCVVVPVRTTDHDWGLLAVVGEIDTTSARETYHHWSALLCKSLESDRLQESVRRSALYDALTGLPNRRLFLDRLERAVARWRRSSTPFAVLFLDLDGFKPINDSYGHAMGDRVLATVATRIEHALRAVDTGARFGGDEFAILLHDVQSDDVPRVAQRVQAAIAEAMFLEGNELSVQASVGVATSAIEYDGAEDVLRDADIAMYHAKETERGTVSYFDAAMHAHAVRQQVLHGELLRALAEQQFVLHYQPIVNLATGRTDRFEALVRWHHPERGLLLPEEFLPLMDDAGLIVRLGHWVLDEVCRQLAAWGPAVASVAVNVSNRELWHKDLLAQLLATLARHGVTADRLTLEITENALIRRQRAARELLGSLRAAGLRIHVDDFGTGFSSLGTLHRFPVDAFKIDRSYIAGLTTGDPTADLVGALVTMGKALGLAVVAEGVETLDQLVLLQRIGCSTAQGYLFMPAVPADEAPALLGRVLGLALIG